MDRRCPICGQSLPKALNQEQLQRRMDDLTAKTWAGERQKLERDHRQHLAAELAAVRFQVERAHRREVFELKQRAQRAEKEKREAADHARRDAEKKAQRNVAQAVRLATRESDLRLEKLETAREKERLRHTGEIARFQNQIDTLSRKLEKQTGQQLGDEAEVNLLAQLKQAFPTDRIERIGRGIKGADILHHILDDEKEVGRIVYESKDTLSWQNAFVTQAKRYQTQYDTRNILIVTRAFPKKKKGLCIANNVPVVSVSMAVALAEIIRNGAIEIARLRLSEKARDSKAQELFDYVVSDRFRTRFVDIADGVMALREHQQKEKDWHEREWENESKLHEKLDKSRREIDGQLKSITRAEVRPMVRKAAASA